MGYFCEQSDVWGLFFFPQNKVLIKPGIKKIKIKKQEFEGRRNPKNLYINVYNSLTVKEWKPPRCPLMTGDLNQLWYTNSLVHQQHQKHKNEQNY